MNGLIEVIGSIIERYVNRDFEEEEIRVMYTGASLKVFIEDDYVELVKGSEYTLPRWITSILYEKGRARIIEQQVDETTISILRFNESRDKSRLKFEKLTGYFYNRVKYQLYTMMKSYREISDLSKALQIVESMKKISSTTKDLYRIRLSKILTLLGGEIPPELVADLSEEEKHLLSILKTTLEVFNKKIFEVGKYV